MSPVLPMFTKGPRLAQALILHHRLGYAGTQQSYSRHTNRSKMTGLLFFRPRPNS